MDHQSDHSGGVTGHERIQTIAKKILGRIDLFSHLVLGIPLYSYQVKPIVAVIDSIINHRGLEFLIIFPRQSGKNEAVAQLLVYLLNIFQRTGGNVVYGAIGDAVGRGITRLEQRLENRWNAGHWQRAAKPTRRILGRAQVTFLSTHPQASARGDTASILLVVDELQDQDPAHIEAVFTPMRAAHNATAVYLGTVRFTHDALWKKKHQLEADEDADGRRRVFTVMPDAVTNENPDYAAFLEAQVRRYGRNHPIVASEYYLEPIDASGGLFDARRINLLTGNQPRQHQPKPNATYIATIDIGGQDEQTAEPGQLDNPRRDYTVITITELTHDRRPIYMAADVMIDHGTRHFTAIDGRLTLAEQILAYLQSWSVAAVIVDASGLGQGLADWLRTHYHNVHPFYFSAASKAQLGSSFIALVEQARARYFKSVTEFDDAWWFHAQATACSYFVRPNGRFERDLKWSVPDSHTTSTPAGQVPTHDDRLISFALIAQAEQLRIDGLLHVGSAHSAVTYKDPLDM